MDNFDYKKYLKSGQIYADVNETQILKESEEISERKKQGYDDREDESLGMRRGAEKGKKDSYKARRDDSYGKFGKRDKEAKGEDKGPGKNKVNKEEVESLKAQLAEAYDTVKTLKTELNEINLLNAKLLYTNKIFKSKNLSESQKVKVLESFDKATTVKEAKLVYETVDAGVKSKKTYVNENLGRASKSAGIAVKKTAKQPIVESDEMVKRFQKLAGIIKN